LGRTHLHGDLAVICCEADKGRGKHLLKAARCFALDVSRLEFSTAEIQQAALALYRNAGYRLVREETVESLSNKTVGSGMLRYYLEKTL
jgi:hypothetical protein